MLSVVYRALAPQGCALRMRLRGGRGVFLSSDWREVMGRTTLQKTMASGSRHRQPPPRPNIRPTGGGRGGGLQGDRPAGFWDGRQGETGFSSQTTGCPERREEGARRQGTIFHETTRGPCL